MVGGLVGSSDPDPGHRLQPGSLLPKSWQYTLPGRLPWEAVGMPVTAQSQGLPSSALLSWQAGGCLEGAPAVRHRCSVGWCEWGGGHCYCEPSSKHGIWGSSPYLLFERSME